MADGHGNNLDNDIFDLDDDDAFAADGAERAEPEAERVQVAAKIPVAVVAHGLSANTMMSGTRARPPGSA